MNCTILNLFIKLSTQNSPLLSVSPYSFQNKFILENLKISHSFSPFYHSFLSNPQKINIKSSSFSNFLDSTFHIDSLPSQFFAEKFEGHMILKSDISFQSCFFLRASFYTTVRYLKFLFDSCFFFGQPIQDQFPINCIVSLIHCSLEDFANITANSITINYTAIHSFNQNNAYPLNIKKIFSLSSSNFTKIVSRLPIFAGNFQVNRLIFTGNEMQYILANNYEINEITNSLFYNNDITGFNGGSSFSDFMFNVTDTCLFFNYPANYFGIIAFHLITFNMQGCCFNHSEDDIRKAITEEFITVNFIDCTFSTNECKLSNISDIALPPKRKKFDYKIIGDIQNEFEINMN